MNIISDINVRVLKEFLLPFKEINSIKDKSDIFTNTDWDIVEILSSKKGLLLIDGILSPVNTEEKKFDEIPIIPNYFYNLLSIFENSDKVNVVFDGNKFFVEGLISRLQIGGNPIISMSEENDKKLSLLKQYKKTSIFVSDVLYHNGEIPSIFFYDKEKGEYAEHYDIEIDAPTFMNAIVSAIPKFFKLSGSKKKSNVLKDKITLIIYNNRLYIYALIKEQLQKYIQEIKIKKMWISEIVGDDELGKIETMEVDEVPNAVITIDYKYLKNIKRSDKIIIRIVKSPKFIREDFSDNIYLDKSLVLYAKKQLTDDINAIYTYNISSLIAITTQIFKNDNVLLNEIGDVQ